MQHSYTEQTFCSYFGFHICNLPAKDNLQNSSGHGNVSEQLLVSVVYLVAVLHYYETLQCRCRRFSNHAVTEHMTLLPTLK